MVVVRRVVEALGFGIGVVDVVFVGSKVYCVRFGFVLKIIDDA